MKRLLILAVAAMTWCVAALAQDSVKVRSVQGMLDTEVVKPASLKPGQKCPVVILMHGFSGQKKSRLFDELIQQLTEKNCAVVRFDFIGHGKSDGEFKDMTLPYQLEDAKAIINYVESLDFCESISLLGHSQGGVVASMTAGNLGASKIKKIVLMAPAAKLREDALRGSTMGKQYNPRDPGEGVEMFGGRVLGAEYIRTAQTLPIYEVSRKYTGPVLLLHGTYDTVVPWTFSEYYSFIYQDYELEYIEGADHGFSKVIPEVAAKAVTFLTK